MNGTQSTSYILQLKVPTPSLRFSPMEPSVFNVVTLTKLSAFDAFDHIMFEFGNPFPSYSHADWHSIHTTNNSCIHLPIFWFSSLCSQNYGGGCPRQLTIHFLEMVSEFFPEFFTFLFLSIFYSYFPFLTFSKYHYQIGVIYNHTIYFGSNFVFKNLV